MVTRFHLFAGDWYYPMAGDADYRGAFATFEEAAAAARRTSCDWAYVMTVDLNDGSLSWTSVRGKVEK